MPIQVPPTSDEECNATLDDELLDAHPVAREARKFTDRVLEYEAVWRPRFLDDAKFAIGDSDNGYQWPSEIFTGRSRRQKPCLTINLVRQRNGIISNTARKNKSSVKFIGLGNGATQQSASVLQDLHRHVEWQSSAQDCYTVARDWQIKGGRGWWRWGTEYEQGSFDQELFILPVLDPLAVCTDPDAKQRTGLDAAKTVVFDDVPREEFFATYPELRHVNLGNNPMGINFSSSPWLNSRSVRVAEYFRKVRNERELASFIHRGRRLVMHRDKLEQVLQTEKSRKAVLADPQTKFRSEFLDEVEWYLIVGNEVVDSTLWPGKYIPLVPVRGEEIVVDGVFDSPGNTRHQKDAQRMFNYNASGQVEFVAGQTKTPWLVAKKAIEEFETDWAQANNETKSVLVWNHLDLDGGSEVPIPPPQRIDPPQASPAYQEGLQTAQQQLELVSGQGARQMGQPGNERTGAAINGVQEQGELSTFQWQDNYETALMASAKIFIDLVPKVYDTKRIKQVLADDGTDYELTIDPAAQQAFLREQAEDGKVIKTIFNPELGRYDIGATVGPDFGSKRRETQQSLSLLLTQAPNLVMILGDLMLKAMDFDGAQEGAQRLKRMIPPQALGIGPSAKEQAMQQQLVALGAEMKKILELNAKDKLKLVGKDQLRDIEAYKAETDRMKALADQLPLDPEGLKALVEQLVGDSMKTNLKEVSESTEEEIETDEPEGHEVPGALKAPDGQWYMNDPTRPGKHLHIGEIS